ncbi:MAG: ABC transporter permease [Candidatus Hodarchaeales archaeon]
MKKFLSNNRGMIEYIGKRLLIGIVVVLAASFLAFSLIHLAPGDPITEMLGVYYTPDLYAQWRAYYGLDQPIPVQFFNFLARAIQFDFGTSFTTGEEISTMILTRLPNTLSLGIAAVFLTLVVGIPLGVYTALKANTFFDNLSRITSLGVLSLPNFWWALLLVYVFSITFRLLPVQGMGMPPDIQHLILPSVALASAQIAVTSRLVRATMLEELTKDYIRTARAKGLSERTVMFKHALRNALPIIITDIGHRAVMTLIGGAVIIEVVFAWPGMGRLMIQSFLDLDYPLIQITILIMAVVAVISNIIWDVVAASLDPRIRKGMM